MSISRSFRGTGCAHSVVSALPIFAAALVAMLVLSGCKEEAPAASYTTRGELKALPAAGAQDGLSLHHEAIPEFVDRQGKKSGMMSMSMPFGVADGLSLEGLAPGDKVEFTFDVNWDRTPASQVTAIKKLPPETELTLEGH